MKSNSVLNAALAYAKRGWLVFPGVRTDEKKSHKSAEYSNGANWGCTTDPATIKKDFNKWKTANVGVVTGAKSGIFVLDVDTKKGHRVNGAASLAALEQKHGKLPKTRMARTPTDGLHYWFKHPGGHVNNSTSNIGKGIDIRGDGGMVYAPPSVRPGKGEYVWLNEEPVADAPDWLVDFVTRKTVVAVCRKPEASIDRVRRALAIIPNEDDLTWDDWNKVGMATWLATGGSEEGFEAFDAWSQKWSEYNAVDTRDKWDTYSKSPPDRIGAGTLFHMAKEETDTNNYFSDDEPDWRERNGALGVPKPSLHNAGVAIAALGIECRHDIFHEKTMYGFRDDDVRHELQLSIGDEVSDDGILMIRKLVSNTFGFDPGPEHMRDAVRQLALANRFDPICDYLQECQGKWDGKKRLDRMAFKYFKCADTPLNRAIIAATMVAAVRRVRQPGCKFDAITVLEGPEGWDKSTAWRVLAGDENFSDQTIIGQPDKVVQEQLQGVWFHENAELAGMSPKNVEMVKAFASRQVDRARPAYGRLLVRRPRRNIEVGTTNGDQYLLSHDGNRRFWPLKCRARVDIAGLRHDRDQLWGEAAAREAKLPRDQVITLPQKLWAVAAVAQEKRRVVDPWEVSLGSIGSETIHKSDYMGGSEVVATNDLIGLLPQHLRNTAATMRLPAIMERLGWFKAPAKLRIAKKQVQGYWRPDYLG